ADNCRTRAIKWPHRRRQRPKQPARAKRPHGRVWVRGAHRVHNGCFDTGAPPMRLYSFTITPNNRKVEAFIRHYDLPVEIHQVSFKDKETQSEAYGAINPMRKVPALTDGDFNLWESNAILTYLATKFPETKALPTDARGRADVDRWLHW